MKRRVLSLMITLALCLNLCPVWVLAAGDDIYQIYTLDADKTYDAPNEISRPMTFDTNGFTLSAPNSSALRVIENGVLTLKGTVVSNKGPAVEVMEGGSLIISDPGTSISGTTCALYVYTGADVELSAGTYTGKSRAIRIETGNYDDLLAPGYAYFDTDGNLLTDISSVRTVVVDRWMDQPALEWAVTGPVTVPYTGSPVTKDQLPVKIEGTKGTDLSAKLAAYLQYSYQEQGSTTYIDGLPTNAGTYNVMVTLPERPGEYYAAASDPITLVISKISPIVTAPSALTLTYNGSPQELVSAGTLHSAAARDGVEIQYATQEQGPYSTSIPTGLDAGNYNVWYQTAETDNYEAVGPTKVSGTTTTIQPKNIQPTIELSKSSYLYDGTKHEPEVTVKDGKTIIDKDQYAIAWDNDLTSAGTHTVTVSQISKKNYTFRDVTAQVEIVEAAQGGLTIIGQPEHVYYGGTITTLRTIGGTGDGTVTWSITGSSTIDADTGVFTVTDTGSITVTAERAVPNYGTVSDTWTFTVEPKPVTAEVTIAAKNYDGTPDIAPGDITAVVKTGDLVDPSDAVQINGLKGTYDNANAGTGKTVMLDDSNVTPNWDTTKYAVSIPAAAKADIKPRQVAVTVTLSDHDLMINKSTNPPKYSYAYDGNEKTPTVTVKANDDNATLAASDYTVSYSNNKNQGTAAVIVKCAAGGNYTFNDERVPFEIMGTAAQLISSPQAKILTYNGAAQDLVTVGVATGGTVVYSLSKIDPDDPKTYSETIPQKTNAGTYTVYYMVKGDGNHDDAGSGQVSVTINPKEITPKITLSPGPYVYSGSAHKPTVTVEDGTDRIDTSEYAVFYRDNINAGTATVMISDANGGNYIVKGTAYFTITKAPASFIATPAGNPGLQYTGAPQDLVKAGGSDHGTVVYSVGGGNYSATIPTGTAVGTYTIDYKVLGDANHSDTTPGHLTVSISKKTVNDPTISLSKDTLKYDGTAQKPDITVYDNGRLIPQYEYKVDIKGTNGSTGMVDVDTYTVTITAADNSNYVFTGKNTRTYQIVPADQETISITGTQARVYYGDVIQLGTTGGTGSGTVTWIVTDANGNPVNSTITTGGLLTVRDVGGSIIVTAERSMGGNYDDISAAWEFSAAKKPVTAVVTASDRDYRAGDSTAAVTAAVPNSELVPGDSIAIKDVTGTFSDANVGTDKKVTIISSSASVSGTNEEKYDITYPAAATASIFAVPAAVENGNEPQAVPSLKYDASQAQALVTAGTPTGGDMVYSLDGTNFTLSIPTGKEAKAYTVYFRVRGDSNHTDSPVGSVQVTIARQTVTTPQIELSPPGAQYDGQVKQPKVILRDSANNVIPATEYMVTYVSDNGENWTDQGNYTVKVENITGGNYMVADAQAIFTISTTAQAPLEITDKPGLVYYGDTFTLSVRGGSGSGTVTWSSNNTAVADVDSNGLVTIKGTGSATIKAKRTGDLNYDTQEAAYPLNALKKPVTPIVTADDKFYDTKTDAVLRAVWGSGDLVGNDNIALTIGVGTFETPDVGTGKQVTFQPGTAVGDTGNYIITWPTSATASINRTFVELDNKPEKKTDLVYTGSSLPLITGGSTKAGIGTIEYSLKQYGEYSSDIPTAVEAGTYSVWYKVEDDRNYVGIPATEIEVEIAPAPSGGGTETTPPDTSDNTDTTPPDTGDNTGTTPPDSSGSTGTTPPDSSGSTGTTPPDTGDGTETTPPDSSGSTGGSSTPGSSSSGTSSAPYTGTATTPTRTTVQNGTASTVVSVADGSRLVREAAANQSESIVIKPEITSDVTKTEVTIPASTVSQIGNQTSAALTISTPVAGVTIPNEALDTLSGPGGSVSVVTEQTDQAVVLTLTAGGENVESLPGGLTLTVPVEDAGPGTVAVLVHEDGTRETIRKSMVEDGSLSIPLNGSATVEIVDNSKDFDDVPSTSWAADAVAFASAHELFSGTGETTFSPDQAMSRGMLAAVLYSLEGCPEQEPTSEFDDVSGGAWYADSIAWATENGITSGYGNGQFGPDDSITREQFVVMLWKYAGSPAPSGQTLDFADADQASGFALDALCWAVENGILSGCNEDQLAPDGTATRAQAAQMLKNFMENT